MNRILFVLAALQLHGCLLAVAGIVEADNEKAARRNRELQAEKDTREKESMRQRKREQLTNRASFDFGCPTEGLSIRPTNDNEDTGPTSYGVEGCNKRAAYMWNGTAWKIEGAPASQ